MRIIRAEMQHVAFVERKKKLWRPVRTDRPLGL